MAMKDKKPGDHIILRLKNNESPLILDWINNQSNLSDAIRFLVEEEIKAHAVRDLQEYIPAKRKPLEAAVEQAASEEAPKVPAEEKAEDAQPAPVREESLSEEDEPAVEETKDHAGSAEKETDKQAEPAAEAAEESESKQKSETQEEDNEDEYSDEIIDHWMNI
ncbi:MAG TPA: hypothetical protein VFT51_13290 [Bacillales bacterium]|nr:hypothetical protein [Bacillales bacterium]